MWTQILFTQKDRIATITLNRPEKLNALSYALIDELLVAFDRIETDPSVGAVILTGAGRAFSVGGDIPEFAGSVRRGTDAALQEFVARGQRLTARIEAFAKPVIVAVNGLAYGGGCEITEAAPLSIAAASALFAKPEIRLGMPPTFGGTQRLPRLAGRKRAMELLLTGEPFAADRALELGLVNEVVPDEALLAATEDLARRILCHSPLAIATVMTAVTRGLNQSIAEGLQVEAMQFARMVPSQDLPEGLMAWEDRRPADWRGR